MSEKDEQKPSEPQQSELAGQCGDAFEKLKYSVTRQPLHREVLLEIMKYCSIPRLQHEVEEHVLSSREGSGALLSPYKLIQQLVKAGGLQEDELDAEGNQVLPERKEGLNEDELDDLVQDWRYKTTETGASVCGYFAPDARMSRLLGVHPTWEHALRSVLAYCKTARSRKELEAHIHEHRLLDGISSDHRPMHSSVLIDKLETAGMLQWERGWCISEAGRKYLDAAE